MNSPARSTRAADPARSSRRMPCNGGPGFVPRALACGTLLAATALTGCTAPSYKMAAKKTPPAAPIVLPATEPPFEVVVHTVIIYHGAGSWKQHAFWDEYVITIANRGDVPIAIDAAELMDFRGQASTPGADPWRLERASRSFVRDFNAMTEDAIVQVGGGMTALAVGGGVGAVLLSGGIGGSAAGAAAGAVFVLPLAVGGTIYLNVANHRAIEREFARRRMNLPVVLLPGQFAQGSLFFRISPGPRQLTLHGRVGDTPCVTTVDLSPLRGLHLKRRPDGAPLAKVDWGADSRERR